MHEQGTMAVHDLIKLSFKFGLRHGEILNFWSKKAKKNFPRDK